MPTTLLLTSHELAVNLRAPSSFHMGGPLAAASVLTYDTL